MTQKIRMALINNGTLRLCSNCNFETLDRPAWRAHERETGHTQNMKLRKEKVIKATPGTGGGLF